MNPILSAIDDGHIANGLKSDGSLPDSGHATCKKDGEVWPCAAIRVGRKRNKEKVDRERLRDTMTATPRR